MHSSFDNGTSLWIIVIRFRWPAAIVAGIIILSACLWAVLAAPIYRVSVTMMSNSEDDALSLNSLAGQFGGIASIAGLDIASAGNDREAAIATLRSRAFTESFIDERQLLPVLFDDLWDSSLEGWITKQGDEPPSLRDGYRVFDKRVRFIEDDFRTGLIRLVVEWSDPELAAEWANEMVKGVNETIRQDAIRQARSNIEYLDRELQNTNVIELRNAIFRLMEVQIQKAMMANVRENFAFEIIDPAVVPDPEEYVRPNRALIIGIGALFGPIFGIFAALTIGFFSGMRSLLSAGAKGEKCVES